MESGLKKKYGLTTAIAMVVGIVIGSGVFYKAGSVLKNTGGSLPQTLLTVLIVGIAMLICSNVFATLATRYEKINGLVDYSEAMLGSSYAYYLGWFMTIFYYPALTACLAWLSGFYTCLLFEIEVFSGVHVVIGALYLIAGYALNALSPKLAGKFQVSSTIIKLIPLIIMAIVGTIVGVSNGTTVEAFTATTELVTSGGGGLFSAIAAFAFAYEGWIIATTINSELRDGKKNLPKALIIGSIIIIVIYLGYFIGMTGAMPTNEIIGFATFNPPADVPVPQYLTNTFFPGLFGMAKSAFSSLFGSPVFGSVALVFIIISCLGTMNGLMLGCTRGAYSIAVRGAGIRPSTMAHVDSDTNMPHNSATVAMLLCGFFYFYWHLYWMAREVGVLNLPRFISWEPDELPILLIYGSYIPIFIAMMIKEKDLSFIKRFVMPGLGVIASAFMLFCAIKAYKVDCLYYLAFVLVAMVIGYFFRNKNVKKAVKKK